MIHGLGGQSGHYRAGVLERLAGEFRCVVVDRPGSGYSRRATGTPATLEAQADALAALIERLQLGRPVVVGHSLGGALALMLALRHPGQVAGLALLAPLSQVPRTVSPVFQGLLVRRAWLRSLIGWTLATPLVILKGRPMMALIFGPEAVPADYGTRGGGLMNLRPSQFVSASQDINALPVSLPALQRRYGELALPLAVLYGRGDRILEPAAQGQALVEQVPGAVLELVEGGHMLPVTQPAISAEFIRAAARRALAATAR
jgi:pimeloyl-ACP methyl ester carboxylesterase